jgi:hypothetical protein
MEELQSPKYKQACPRGNNLFKKKQVNQNNNPCNPRTVKMNGVSAALEQISHQKRLYWPTSILQFLITEGVLSYMFIQ